MGGECKYSGTHSSNDERDYLCVSSLLDVESDAKFWSFIKRFMDDPRDEWDLGRYLEAHLFYIATQAEGNYQKKAEKLVPSGGVELVEARRLGWPLYSVPKAGNTTGTSFLSSDGALNEDECTNLCRTRVGNGSMCAYSFFDSKCWMRDIPESYLANPSSMSALRFDSSVTDEYAWFDKIKWSHDLSTFMESNALKAFFGANELMSLNNSKHDTPIEWADLAEHSRYAHFVASNYKASGWSSSVGNFRATIVGERPQLDDAEGHGFLEEHTHLVGGKGTSIDFGKVLPSHKPFTMVALTRATQVDFGRVLTSKRSEADICIGHFSGQSNSYRHGNTWFTNASRTFANNWQFIVVQNKEKPTVMINGKNKLAQETRKLPATSSPVSIGINTWTNEAQQPIERSDWAFAELATWDVHLTRSQLDLVQKYFVDKYSLDVELGATGGLWIPRPLKDPTEYKNAVFSITLPDGIRLGGLRLLSTTGGAVPKEDGVRVHNYEHGGEPLSLSLEISNNATRRPTEMVMDATWRGGTYKYAHLLVDPPVLCSKLTMRVVRWEGNGPPIFQGCWLYLIKNVNVSFQKYTYSYDAYVSRYCLAAYAMVKNLQDLDKTNLDPARMHAIDRWYKKWLEQLSRNKTVNSPRQNGVDVTTDDNVQSTLSFIFEKLSQRVTTEANGRDVGRLFLGETRMRYEQTKNSRIASYNNLKTSKVYGDLFNVTQNNLAQLREAILHNQKAATAMLTDHSEKTRSIRQTANAQYDLIERLQYRRRYLIVFMCMLVPIGIVQCSTALPTAIQMNVSAVLLCCGTIAMVILFESQRKRRGYNFNEIDFGRPI